jgi:5S rRNA maturation endonuclease (ribonuclease M5)
LKDRKVHYQKALIREIHYEVRNKHYFGIGFYNNSEGIEIRNKYTKICLGTKDLTVIQKENSNKRDICIFEGFFDYLTLRNLEKTTLSSSDYLILNSTAMLFKTSEILKEYDKISLFLDNDDNGNLAKEIIKQKYKNVEDCSLIYKNYKDLNEWYCEKE